MGTTAAVRHTFVGGVLGFVVAYAIAGCGGVIRDDGSGNGDEAGGTGGVLLGGSGAMPGKAGGGKATTGATAQGASAGRGGASGGKAGGAGTTSNGGSSGSVSSGGSGDGISPSRGGGVCGELLCPTGSVPYLPPGASCPTCGPNCAAVNCAFPTCPTGQVPVVPSDQCCPACTSLPDASTSCDQNGYVALRKALEDKYSSYPCMVDSECMIGAASLCGVPDCGTVLNGVVYKSFLSDLSAYSRANCIACLASLPIRCPPTSGVARCVNGRCLLGAL